MKKEGLAGFRRVLAGVLCLVMVISVTHMPAIHVHAETEEAVPENLTGGTQTASGSALEQEEETDTATGSALGIGGTFKNPEIEYIETSDTTARVWSIWGMDTGKPDLIDGTAVQWIDRLNTTGEFAFIREFYDMLVEGSNNDGTDDFLIDDSFYYDVEGNTVSHYEAVSIELPITLSDGTIPATQEEAQARMVEIYTEKKDFYKNCALAGYDAFDRDHPEVFWLSGTTAWGTSRSSLPIGDAENGWSFVLGVIFWIQHVPDKDSDMSFNVREPEYNSQTVIEATIAEVNSNASAILSAVEGKTDLEKIRYFNEWLTKNNAYNSSDDLDTIGHDCREVTSALEGLAGEEGPVCEAYARAFKLLCDRSGIDCVLVDGYPSTAPGEVLSGHMWNYVKVDGAWYAVDVTWNDPMVSGKEEEKVSEREDEAWLLLGSQTITEYGMTYIDTHPVENALRSDGVGFINGPELSETAYDIPKVGPSGLSVGDVYVTDGDGSTTGCTTSGTAGSGTWSYANGVLTLTDATSLGDICWISGDLTIVLNGSNGCQNIAMDNSTGAEGTLTIQGPGELEAADVGRQNSAVLSVLIKNCVLKVTGLRNAKAGNSIIVVGDTATVYGEVTLPSDLIINNNQIINFTTDSCITNLDKLWLHYLAIIQVNGVTHTHNTSTTYTAVDGTEQKHTKTVACADCPIQYKTETEEDCTVSAATCSAKAKCQYCRTEYGEPDATKHNFVAATGICTICSTQAQAKVENTYYATLDEAVDAWTDNTTLTLMDDVTIDHAGYLIFGNGLTLDLNGKTWLSTNKAGIPLELSPYDAFDSTVRALLITDSSAGGTGRIESESKYAIIASAGHTILEKGTLVGCIDVSAFTGIVVTGGTIIADIPISMHGDCNFLEISGGTLNGTTYGIYNDTDPAGIEDYSMTISGTPSINGGVYDIYTTLPITFETAPATVLSVGMPGTPGVFAVGAEGVVLSADMFTSDSYEVLAEKDSNNSYSVRLAKHMASAELSLSLSTNAAGEYTAEYTGAAITPSVSSVVLDGTTLTQDTDYTVSYSNNTNVGTATVTVTGIGIYSGTATKTFKITPATLTVTGATATGKTYDQTATVSITGVTLSGVAAGDTVAVDVTNVTGTVSSANAASYTTVTLPDLTLTGEDAGNYMLTQPIAAVACNVTISAKTVTAPTFSGLNASYGHTGTAITPSFKLMDGTVEIPVSEYSVAYSNNTNLGTATVTITDVTGGNYTVSGTKTFEIVEHVHVWKYVASGAVITATCEGTIGTCPVANRTVKVTLAAPTAVIYDGTAKAATVTQSPAEVFTLPVITYNTTDGNAPTNAGAYTAAITLGGATVSVDYTVQKADFPVNTVTLPWRTNLTYAHGTAQTVIGTVDLTAAPQGSVVTYSTSTNGTTWSAWGTTVPTMTNAGTLQVKVKISGNTNYKEYISGAQTITMAPYTLGSSGEILSVADVTYTGLAQTPAVVLTSAGTVPGGLEANLLAGRDCTVAYANNVNVTTDGNPATVTITGTGNYTGTLTADFSIRYLTTEAVATAPADWVKKATVTAPAGFTISNSLTGTYGASFDVTTSGADENGTVVTYYLKQEGTGYISAAKTVTVKVDSEAPVFDANAFEITELTGTMAEFTWAVEDNRGVDGCSVYYAASAESLTAEQFYELGKQANGEFTLSNLAANTTYYITITAKDAVGNYGILQKSVTTKKAGFTTTVNKNYLYSKDKTDSINLAALLPDDCEETAFGAIDKKGDVIYTAEPVLTNGVLSYTVKAGAISDAGQITVSVESKNYDTITISIIITLTDQKPVSLQAGSAVTATGTLTYGDSLAKLILGSAIFVDDEGNMVEGTLCWKDETLVPNAGTPTAVWVFTPDNAEYADLEGTTAITVNKAGCVIFAVPVVADRVYHPTSVLTNTDLTGGTVSMEGTWSWKEAGIVPTVNNSGYVAVFTPKDTTNYETTERTIAVNVAKATPMIQTAPTAVLTYGMTLSEVELTGGEVQYNAEDATAVAGTFFWKNNALKPVVTDSGVTEYAVIFTPADTTNYNAVETKITVTVNKAQNAPNMPESNMAVSNSKETVGAVALPNGWAWAEADSAKELEVDVPLQATAIYVGADKGNYITETVVVTINRCLCDHHDNTDDGICDNCGYVIQVYYTINVISSTGGNASASCVRAPKGRRISLSYTADFGFTFGGWNSYDVSLVGRNSFIMPAGDVTIIAMFFADAPEPSVTEPTPIPTAMPEQVYNPEESWFAPGTYKAEEKQYDVVLGASKEKASLGSVLKVGSTVDLNFYGVKNWTKNAYTVKWTTSDSSIAVVDNLGNVTMLDNGIAIIRLELIHKETGTKLNVAPMEVGVPEADYDIFLGTSAKDTNLRREIGVGQKLDLNFYGVKNWKKDDYEYEWYSSDKEVAVVDKRGLVTGLKAGKAVIRLKMKNKKTGEYLVVAPVVITVPEEKK
ncbi:MAG: Ig-like domain-containing protein [Lachnospiraceae bacterium]|nr:Ig-like domain-containing protein [Lachnospiraceae bacterium]